MTIKAVFFDLHRTLVLAEERVSDERACELLASKGHEVFPQGLSAAWQYVLFLDYPRYGYKKKEIFLKRVLQRVSVRPDEQTWEEFTALYNEDKWTKYPDVDKSIARAKKANLKTAIITSIPKFFFEKALSSIWNKIDLVVDGYTFHCEKSNPKIYMMTMNSLGVEPADTVMIGDDVELDIKPPKRFGMKAILLDREGKASKEDRAIADATVKDLLEAMDVVEGRTK